MIFIPYNVPSSKNTKQWTGKYLVWSKTAQRYVRNTEQYWINERGNWLNAIQGKQYPYRVSFKFIRGTRHRFDYVNPLQTVLDLMVKYEWIEDDNSDIILPSFEPYEYNKECPGVEIRVLT